ncbi:hypothetical protein PHYBOEH_007847 [Phytophthora boehmeriae]|uniref:Alpha-carbonic anhydrase domain-containing protein n=1 Tax=Phytophthora boehmeriae TaxID=109152 RepID=A0A8T1W4G3_9STRA|nr:hypothetical protein PHYBOEH_007847 [Phytophthora boehmeriae]
MKFIASVSAVVATCALSASTVAAAGAKGEPWGYKYNDSTMASPDMWAEYYPGCGGDSQSPIDIVVADVEQGTKVQSSLRFRGECEGFNLTQGEDFKAAVIGGDCAVKAKSGVYDLAQFHVHVPSEHTLDGEPLDGEVHFVHSNKDGSKLLVVGIFMEIDPEGDTDPWLETVIDGIDDVTPDSPTLIDLTSYSAVVKKSVRAGSLFNYPGGLTTPGCDEIVDWWVVQKPIKVSAKDHSRIQNNQGEFINTDDGENARPVQPLNKRTVVQFK